MSNLRQAAQQALEALEEQVRRIGPEFDDPFAYGLETDRWALMRKAIPALRAALAEPEQEPVGHADLGINNIYIFSELEPRVVPVGRTPLYTAPTPRKPLPTIEIIGMYNAQYDPAADDGLGFARAIERAHGIGEQQ